MEKSKEKEEDALYKTFWLLYSTNTIKLSQVFLKRITERHYRKNTMRVLVRAGKWFRENYNLNNYLMSWVNYPQFNIQDADGNAFVEYVWSDNMPIMHSEKTEWLISKLQKAGIYDAEVHTPVDGAMPDKEYYAAKFAKRSIKNHSDNFVLSCDLYPLVKR